ncbi:oocyte-expressed protein homolog [Meriones unguiculatus]|nr:oocyte-expressed protein homolog [Meriones unguiculatus]
MEPHTADAQATPDDPTWGPSSLRLLRAPPVSLRLRVRPWWFPAQELSNPLVFFMEAWIAEKIFGPNQAKISEMEWMTQTLLTVDTADSGNLTEITVFGRPSAQARIRRMLLSKAEMHKEKVIRRATKMKQLEEFLKVHSPINLCNTEQETHADTPASAAGGEDKHGFLKSLYLPFLPS